MAQYEMTLPGSWMATVNASTAEDFPKSMDEYMLVRTGQSPFPELAYQFIHDAIILGCYLLVARALILVFLILASRFLVRNRAAELMNDTNPMRDTRNHEGGVTREKQPRTVVKNGIAVTRVTEDSGDTSAEKEIPMTDRGITASHRQKGVVQGKQVKTRAKN